MKKISLYILVLLTGLLLGKFIFGPKTISSPALVKYDGKEITLNQVSTALGEKPGQSGNTLVYKQQLAMGMMRNNITDDLAKKAGLSTAEFILKIKSAADTKLSEEEITAFLLEIKMDRKKLTKAQFDNITANMKEHKREIYFNEYLNKVVAGMKVEQ